jgi:hypothetical protein
VKVERFLIGEGRPVAVGFLRHFNTLPPATEPNVDVSGSPRLCSRHRAPVSRPSKAELAVRQRFVARMTANKAVLAAEHREH